MNIKKTNKEITQKLNKIENALKRKLDAFYNSNIKDSVFPTDSLRRKYETTVKNLIRQTVQQGYLTGTDIVTNQISNINNEFVPFISVTDVQNIQNVTEKVHNQFWKTADRLHRREQEFILTPNQDLELKHQFDTGAAIIGLSAYAAFSAFNNAVLSKIQIVNNNLLLATGELETTDTIDLLNLKGKVMFLTQEDAAVDPEICEPLNRTVYDSTDFDIPEPPLHAHCRCRLVPIVDEFNTGEIV